MIDSLAGGLQSAIPIVLRPLIRLLFRSGLSYREFSAISKRIFVEIALQEVDPRGRSSNISRVAARTGLSRKSVRIIREELRIGSNADRVESNDLNPLTVVLHHWHNDPNYLDAQGAPLPLPFSDTDCSFSRLVKQYAGDLPPGAIRTELKVVGAVVEDSDGLLRPIRSFLTPKALNEEFIRSMAFSWSNLGETLTKNAEYYGGSAAGEDQAEGLLERYVWTDRLSEESIREFKYVAELKAGNLLSDLDRWIGSKESRGDLAGNEDPPLKSVTCGVGLYYFERR